MPAPNPRRRRALADAAIALLAEQGTHGLTHRAVETRGGVPAGTATNYFRDREALLTAAAERVIELHLADMAAATAGGGTPADVNDEGADEGGAPARPGDAARSRRRETGTDELVDMLAESLWTAATELRDRYLAVFQLQLEARRRPELAVVLARIGDAALADTTVLHGEIGSPMPEASVATLITLYSGTLFNLVARPVDTLDRVEVRTLAEAMVRGALASGSAGSGPAGGQG